MTEPSPSDRAGLRSLGHLLRPHRRSLATAGLLALLAAAALAQPLLVRRVIHDIQTGRPRAVAVTVLVIALVVAAVLSGLQSYLLQRTGEAVVLSTRVQLVRRLLRLPVTELDRRRTGDLISRVGADTTLLRTVVTSGLVDVVSGLVIAVGALVAMATVTCCCSGSPWSRWRSASRGRSSSYGACARPPSRRRPRSAP